ncbi:MAG: DUF4139 domain-containing protein [Amphritea sp.]
MYRSLLTLTLGTLLLSKYALSAPLVVDAQKQQALTLTLYNQNLGLVRDVRSIPQLAEGQRLFIEDVSHQMMSETLRVEQAGEILEQNLNTNLISPNSLLQAHVGKSLKLARSNPATGQETLYDIKLLSVQGNQAVIEKNSQVEIIPSNSSGWRFIFPTIPVGMQSRPSLEILSNGTSKSSQAVLTYLTQGMNWHMDYAINLNNEGTQLSLDGLATLSNQTGVDYPDSRIFLMAGQVNQQTPIRFKQPRAAMMAMSDTAESGQPQQLQDYQLYKLPHKTTLLNNQTKQVKLISASNVNVSQAYQYNFPVYAALNRSEQEAKPDIELAFNNHKSDGLGFPLPAGTARVFSPDPNGIKQFIGSAQIRHTAEGQQVKLPIGKAFDLTIKQRQSNFKKNYDSHLVSHELTVRNSRAKPATIKLNADFSQPWSVEESNQPFKKISASRAQWTVTVPGNQEIIVTFRANLSKN